MAQSLDRNLLHYVFSTKEREAWLTDSVRNDLHACIGGLVRKCGVEWNERYVWD